MTKHFIEIEPHSNSACLGRITDNEGFLRCGEGSERIANLKDESFQEIDLIDWIIYEFPEFERGARTSAIHAQFKSGECVHRLTSQLVSSPDDWMSVSPDEHVAISDMDLWSRKHPCVHTNLISVVNDQK